MSQRCQFYLWSSPLLPMWLCGRWRTWSLVATSPTTSTATHIAPVRTQHAPVTGTSTYAQKSWGGHPRCDLAPLTTSFGTVGQWERQHLAMADFTFHATPPRTVLHRPFSTCHNGHGRSHSKLLEYVDSRALQTYVFERCGVASLLSISPLCGRLHLCLSA